MITTRAGSNHFQACYVKMSYLTIQTVEAWNFNKHFLGSNFIMFRIRFGNVERTFFLLLWGGTLIIIVNFKSFTAVFHLQTTVQLSKQIRLKINEDKANALESFPSGSIRNCLHCSILCLNQTEELYKFRKSYIFNEDAKTKRIQSNSRSKWEFDSF